MPLWAIPDSPTPPASEARMLLEAERYREAAEFCQRHLAALEQQIPARSRALPQQTEPASTLFQYYALTAILADALAALGEWKAAKEVLGKYRVHFPNDPWGFEAGAQITRRDPDIKDQAAVQRAVELLEGEAQRLRVKLQR